jgi:homoserine O-acetyltransferase
VTETISHAPDVFRVLLETSAGRFAIEVYRSWAPHGAERFWDLVQSGYYNDSRFFRVVAGRWVQFGIAGRPEIAQAWRARTIPDDRLQHPNQAGTIAFANTGPGTRATQVYINLRDNSSQLDVEPAFAPFGRVVSGMEVVLRLHAGYGETSGGGMRAGAQDRLFSEGNEYLDAAYPRLDRLIQAMVTAV